MKNTGCLGMLLAPIFGKKSAASVSRGIPYAKRDDFLSAAEISFFHVLKSTLSPNQHLLTKVNLADLFFVQQPHQNRSARARIDRKHVDFLICDARTMTPLVALELDDSSHRRSDRQERDAFVDQVFATAGLPLIHIPAARGYQVEQLRQQLATYLQDNETPTTTTPVDMPVSSESSTTGESQDISQGSNSHDSKTCPKCGSNMVERTAKRGLNTGQLFWGCAAYPKCRYTLQSKAT